jgi:hypothetical protein
MNSTACSEAMRYSMSTAVLQTTAATEPLPTEYTPPMRLADRANDRGQTHVLLKAVRARYSTHELRECAQFRKIRRAHPQTLGFLRASPHLHQILRTTLLVLQGSQVSGRHERRSEDTRQTTPHSPRQPQTTPDNPLIGAILKWGRRIQQFRGSKNQVAEGGPEKVLF